MAGYHGPVILYLSYDRNSALKVSGAFDRLFTPPSKPGGNASSNGAVACNVALHDDMLVVTLAARPDYNDGMLKRVLDEFVEKAGQPKSAEPEGIVARLNLN